MNHNRKNLLAAASIVTFAAAAVLCLPTGAMLAPASVAPAVATAAAEAPLGGGQRAAIAPALAWYGAAPGTQLRYDLALDMSVGVQGEDENRPFASAAAGTLLVTVLDRRGDEILVACTVPDLRLAVQGDVDGATTAWQQGLRGALAKGIAVRMDGNGRGLGMRFDACLTSDQRNWARALWTTFCFRLDGDAAAWQTDDEDAMGAHRFGYRRIPTADGEFAVERTRVAFTPHGARAASAPAQHSGQATARFTAAVGWLQHAEVEEQLAWTVDGCGLQVTSHVHGGLTLRGTSRVCVVADWDGVWSPISGQRETSTAAMAQIEADWDRRLAGLDLPTAVARMRAMLAAGQGESRDYFELLWCVQKMLERDPALAARIEAMVRGGEVRDEAAAGLLSALGMAGDPQAQHALGAVFTDARLGDDTRLAAVESMFQVAHPTSELVDGVRQSLQACGSMGDVDRTAMLALGAFAATGARGGDGQDLTATLLGHEGLARSSGAAAVWGEALGNSGDAAVLPVAERLFGSADPLERQRALTMVRRIDLPAAHELLAAGARADAADDVRLHAVQLLGENAEAWTTALLAERASADAAVEVRRAAITALGTRRESDAVARRVLGELLGREGDAGLRSLLQQLVVPA